MKTVDGRGFNTSLGSMKLEIKMEYFSQKDFCNIIERAGERAAMLVDDTSDAHLVITAFAEGLTESMDFFFAHGNDIERFKQEIMEDAAK